MGGRDIIFDDKKINKNNFCKSKRLFNIYDIDVGKILISKNINLMVKRAHLNPFWDIMMMMSLDLFV